MKNTHPSPKRNNLLSGVTCCRWRANKHGEAKNNFTIHNDYRVMFRFLRFVNKLNKVQQKKCVL